MLPFVTTLDNTQLEWKDERQRKVHLCFYMTVKRTVAGMTGFNEVFGIKNDETDYLNEGIVIILLRQRSSVQVIVKSYLEFTHIANNSFIRIIRRGNNNLPDGNFSLEIRWLALSST